MTGWNCETVQNVQDLILKSKVQVRLIKVMHTHVAILSSTAVAVTE